MLTRNKKLKDFYGYRRKTVAVLYERMRLLGVWEEK